MSSVPWGTGRWVPAPALARLDALSLCLPRKEEVKMPRISWLGCRGGKVTCRSALHPPLAPAALAKLVRVLGSCWSETELKTQLEFGLSG